MAPTVPHSAAHADRSAPSRAWQPADYEQAIDAEMWAYVAKANDRFPPESGRLPIERQRAIYNAMCRDFHAGRPPNVHVRDEPIDGPGGALIIRRYRRVGAAGDARVLFFHGGGFVLGDLDSHDDICAEICAHTGFEVVSADYRLAPEHPHPAAFDDACAAFAWAAAGDRPVLLCGESAGGNLAAAVAHAARRHGTAPIGQVLICPDLGGDVGTGTYVTHAEAPMLGTSDVLFYRQARFGGREGHVDPITAPLADTDFSGLPPTVVVTAACDPLSGDGEVYCGRIAAAGGRGWWREEAGLTHSFLRARRLSRRAAQAFEQILAAIAALGGGEWPY
jgi:acetyl esterase